MQLTKRKLAVTILSFLLISCGVFSMGLSDLGKVCLFSEMSGVVKLDGKPVAGVRLVRTVNLSTDITDETVTDSEGRFHFPAAYEKTVTKYLPQEFVSNQEITAHFNNKQYRMWSAVKRTPEENSESRGKPLVVTCNLDGEETLIKVNRSPIFSLCNWDVEPDKKRRGL